MYEFHLHACLCLAWVLGVQGGQMRPGKSLELKSQAVVSQPVGAENLSQILWKSSGAFKNHWAVYPGLIFFFSQPRLCIWLTLPEGWSFSWVFISCSFLFLPALFYIFSTDNFFQLNNRLMQGYIHVHDHTQGSLNTLFPIFHCPQKVSPLFTPNLSSHTATSDLVYPICLLAFLVPASLDSVIFYFDHSP